MARIELSSGTVEYQDSGGSGPVLVFIHGLLMDGTVWRKVVDQLPHYRCVRPTLPLGGHRLPMNADADLSLTGVASVLAEFLDALDLQDVILVQNDWGGAQIMIAGGQVDRVAAMVLTSCEAFEKYPPTPAQMMVLAAKIPGGIRCALAILNTRLGRRGPGAWGWMSKRAVPTEVIDNWFRPATESAEIRRDLAKYINANPPRRERLRLAAFSSSFTRPVLVAWASEDRMFPISLGRRLAESFPNSRFVEIADSYTLIPEDNPNDMTRVIQEFVESVGVR